MGSGDHQCEWREKVERLETDLGYAARAVDAAEKLIAAQRDTIRLKDEALAKLGERVTSLQGTVDKLQRHVFGKRSEKMPRVADAIRDPERANAERIEAQQLRRENARTLAQLLRAARSVGRADALPHRPAPANRQQRFRTRAARRGPRPEELPLRRIGRGWREPRRSLLAHRDVRGERGEPGHLPR
jgi:hypothetical protein